MIDRSVAPSPVETDPGFSYSGTELDPLSLARNYYDMILGYFDGHVGSTVVEVGAGIGTFAAYLLERHAVQSLTLVEPAVNNFPVLRERFAGDNRVGLFHGYLDDLPAGACPDTVVAVNVLEHVPDDAQFLHAAHRLLANGGKLLLFVPAQPWAYGSLDRAFGHVRRYTKPSLHALLAEAGFGILRCRHVNCIGLLPWLVWGRLLKRTSLSPRGIVLFDRLIVPWLSRIERRWEPPIGQSIVAVAQKRSTVP